jgi:D-glycero-alpha-D-manno-heptose-7-phosphate kinase
MPPMISKKIRVTAPCRVDFAGGTLDLWPLCALLGDVQTVNHAITRRAEVTVEARDGELSEVLSKDLGLRLVVQDKDPGIDEGPLELIALALRAIAPPHPVTVTVYSPVPKGSGLGASSTILIAALNALSAYRNEARSHIEFVSLARDLEARLIEVPTGTQDYWAALRGGLSGIHYYAGQNIGAPLEDLIVGSKLQLYLKERLLVLYSGEQHFSAAPNWSMLKAFIENEGQGQVRSKFKSIAKSARAAARAFRDDDPEALELAIQAEWEARKQLSDAVCPPRIEEVMGFLKEAGVTSMKLCGAGGGGSMLCLAPREKHDEVLMMAGEYGLTHLDCTLDDQGVIIEEL